MSTYTMSRTTPRVRIAERALQPSGTTRRAPNGAEYDHRFVASTELLASDGGVILVGAWGPGLPAYMRRPRWIANHDIGGFSKLNEVSLGRGVHAAGESGFAPSRVGKSGRALVVYVKYASTPFAQEIRTLYDEGGLDDVSVRWDWRTEQLRPPTDEERELHGDGLVWVAERADLVELSAVLLGADAGAQVIRSDVVAAFERVRAGGGKQLPVLEQLIRRYSRTTVSVGTRAEPELSAATATIDDLLEGSTALGGWLDAVGPIRQQLADAVVAMQNLVGVATAEGDDEDPDEAAAALRALSAALTTFDIALRDVRPAVAAVTDAVRRLAEAAGVAEFTITDPDDRVVIDVEKILADVAAHRRRTAARSPGVERVTIGGREFVVDVDAIRRDKR